MRNSWLLTFALFGFGSTLAWSADTPPGSIDPFWGLDGQPAAAIVDTFNGVILFAGLQTALPRALGGASFWNIGASVVVDASSVKTPNEMKAAMATAVAAPLPYIVIGMLESAFSPSRCSSTLTMIDPNTGTRAAAFGNGGVVQIPGNFCLMKHD